VGAPKNASKMLAFSILLIPPAPPAVLPAGLIITLAGDQCEHVIVAVRQGAQIVGTHFGNISLPPGVDDDLVAVLQGVHGCFAPTHTPNFGKSCLT